MTLTPDRDAHGEEAWERYDPDEGDDHQPAWAHDFMIGSLRAARALLDKMEGR